MTQPIEIKVPDIGDFHDVSVIEVLVKPGDAVEVETPLITLETDKATLEVPSPMAGMVTEVNVKVNDKVSQGSLILKLEPPPPPEAPGPSNQSGETPEATQTRTGTETPRGLEPEVTAAELTPESAPPHGMISIPGRDIHADVVVLGAGPGGYTAAFRAADLGKNVVLIERYPTLGGVCLNVGCIPSKALLHIAKVITDAEETAHQGISFDKPGIELDKLRSWKDSVTARLTKGLAALAKQRKVTRIQGTGTFISSNMVHVETAEGTKTVSFEHCIIAAGSSAARIPGFPYDDSRLMDSTGALELEDIPKRMLIIGGGIIGLEMATVYDALGSRISVVELMDQLIPGADPDLIRPLHRRIQKRYEAIHLKTKVTRHRSPAGGPQGDLRGSLRRYGSTGAATLRSNSGRGRPPPQRSGYWRGKCRRACQ